MFTNLVTYHVYRQAPLPPLDALAYQYLLAGNGLFIRAETRFFHTLIPVTACMVRGLPPLQPHFQLRTGRIPERLLTAALADARRAQRPDGGLNEALYHFHHHGRVVQVRKPVQQAGSTRVRAAGRHDPAVLCELHTHGTLPAFWSATDDADEQGARLYAVAGCLDGTPEIQVRVGVYGYWYPLPVTAVFSGLGGCKDLHAQQKENKPCLPMPLPH